MIRVLALAVFIAGLISNPVFAQTITAPPGPSQADVSAAVAAVQAQIPQPANATPPSEASAASMGGQAMRYALEDHIHQRISRVVIVTADASGNWSASWSAMPLASVPAIFPVAVNSGSQPIVCNVATRTTTGATGRCWMARTLPATLTVLTNLISYDVFGSPAASSTIMVLALPPS